MQQELKKQTTRRLLVIAAPLTLLVIGVGAYTRLNDAGLGCPDWPGCYGQLVGVPDIETAATHSPDAPLDVRKAWIEVAHRYVAGILGLLFFAAAFFAARQKPIFWPPIVLAVLVIAQSLLGMLTVTEKLKPIVVTSHLLGGMSIIAVLAYSLTLPHRHLALLRGDATHAQKQLHQLRIWALAAAVILCMQIFLGGWVSTNYAALSCPDFPLCSGRWVPDIEWSGFVLSRDLHVDAAGEPITHAALVTIHWLHRVGAIIATLILIGLAVFLYRINLFGEAKGLLILLAVQIALGMTNILAGLPLWSAVLHNIVAALLVIKIAKILAIAFASKNTAQN